MTKEATYYLVKTKYYFITRIGYYSVQEYLNQLLKGFWAMYSSEEGIFFCISEKADVAIFLNAIEESTQVDRLPDDAEPDFDRYDVELE